MAAATATAGDGVATAASLCGAGFSVGVAVPWAAVGDVVAVAAGTCGAGDGLCTAAATSTAGVADAYDGIAAAADRDAVAAAAATCEASNGAAGDGLVKKLSPKATGNVSAGKGDTNKSVLLLGPSLKGERQGFSEI